MKKYIALMIPFAMGIIMVFCILGKQKTIWVEMVGQLAALLIAVPIILAMYLLENKWLK